MNPNPCAVPGERIQGTTVAAAGAGYDNDLNEDDDEGRPQ